MKTQAYGVAVLLLVLWAGGARADEESAAAALGNIRG
jgi:hypothetical protein